MQDFDEQDCEDLIRALILDDDVPKPPRADFVSKGFSPPEDSRTLFEAIETGWPQAGNPAIYDASSCFFEDIRYRYFLLSN